MLAHARLKRRLLFVLLVFEHANAALLVLLYFDHMLLLQFEKSQLNLDFGFRQHFPETPLGAFQRNYPSQGGD